MKPCTSWAIVVGLLLGGCVRGGFGTSASPGDAPRPRDRSLAEGSSAREHGLSPDKGGVVAEAGSVPPDGATAANDSCKSPYTVSMAGKTSLSIAMDFTGAKHDQNIACCFGAPDLVVRIDDAPPDLEVTCEGGGSFSLVSGATCPEGESSCYTGSCAPGNSASVTPSGTIYLVICRPDATPMKLLLALGGA